MPGGVEVRQPDIRQSLFGALSRYVEPWADLGAMFGRPLGGPQRLSAPGTLVTRVHLLAYPGQFLHVSLT